MTSEIGDNSLGNLAKLQKRREKDQRRKHYDDQQVQGTNNSSIVSKRSVEKLYFPQIQQELGSWFSHFVPSLKKDRRSPAINRGYWIRMESIRRTLYKIIASQGRNKDLASRESSDKCKRKIINVVNLGCGFDPLPFQMLSMKNKDVVWDDGEFDVKFFDIDYPDLVQEKYLLIQKSDEIKQLIGDEVGNDTLCKLNTANYKLIGCDLKNLSQYQQIVDHLFSKDTSSDEMNIFIAEVSLAYMKPEYANPVIGISSKTSNSNFIILEQIMPDGAHNAFATKMLYHFAHLRSPIQCVELYSTKLQQLQRFQLYYNFAEVRNLFENWQWLIEDDEIKGQMMQVEEFDEWEEFILFCQHYIVLHATNDERQLVYDEKLTHDFQVDEEEEERVVFEIDEGVKLSIDDRFDEEVDILQVKFPACSRLNDKVYVHGGLKQTRTNETIVVDYKSGKIERQLQDESREVIPKPRMCHCLTNVGGDLILSGGRTRPCDVKGDVYKFDGQHWSHIVQLDAPRARHSTVAINKDEVLIFGGLQESSNADPFIILNVKTNQILSLEPRGEYIENLNSATIVYNQDKNEGYIYGGFNECHLPNVNDRLYKFTIDYDSNQIKLDVVLQHLMFARIGSQAQLINNGNKLLIAGGVSSETILTSKTNIVTLQLDTLVFKSVEVPLNVSSKHPIILIGFGLVAMNQHLSLIVGGGAVCYSFGSCYNCVYRLEY